MPSGSEIEKQQRLLEQAVTEQYKHYGRLWPWAQFWSDRMADEQTRRGERMDPVYSQQMNQLAKYFGFAGEEVTAPTLAETEGLSPQAMAALKGQAIEGTGLAFDDATAAVMKNLGRRGLAGGLTAGTGDLARMLGPIYAQQAMAKGQALRGITLTDEELRRKNWEANRAWNLNRRALLLQGLQGGLGSSNELLRTIAASYNPSKYMPGFTSVVSAANRPLEGATAAIGARPMKKSFWEQISPIIGAAGGAFTNWMTGGFGGNQPGPDTIDDFAATDPGRIPPP
jgi:hypothetical protein